MIKTQLGIKPGQKLNYIQVTRMAPGRCIYHLIRTTTKAQQSLMENIEQDETLTWWFHCYATMKRRSILIWLSFMEISGWITDWVTQRRCWTSFLRANLFIFGRTLNQSSTNRSSYNLQGISRDPWTDLWPEFSVFDRWSSFHPLALGLQKDSLEFVREEEKNKNTWRRSNNDSLTQSWEHGH